MTKKYTNKKVKNIENKTKKVQEKEKIKKVGFLTVLPIIISCFALVVSCYMAYSQSQYAEAEYEYKRDPKFNINADVEFQKMSNGESTPFAVNFNVDIVLKNNIDRLYIVSPEKEVKEIMVNDEVSEQIGEYFDTEYKDRKPDIFTENDQIAYYYRFMIYSTINNSMDIKILFGKISTVEPSNFMDFQVVDEVKVLEFEQAHKDDPHYEGEKQIAREYRNLEKYFQDYM